MRCPQCGGLGATPETCDVDIMPGKTSVYCRTCRIRTYIPNEILRQYMEPMEKERVEKPTMKVSYNGFTGLLLKLEAKISELRMISGAAPYSLDIWDEDKHVTYSFNGVNLADIKFLGGAVSFGE